MQNYIPSRVAILLGQWRLMEEVWGPGCGRLASHAGEQEEVAEQGSDFIKVVNGIFCSCPEFLLMFCRPRGWAGGSVQTLC